MKRIYFLSILNILLLHGLLSSQVTGVMLQLEQETEKSNYSVNLVITEGSAIKPSHRAQYLSQVSLVVPSNTELTLIENFMPLQVNNNYTGINPLIWVISSMRTDDMSSPKLTYYSIITTLSPTSYYNDLKVGDKIKLFSVYIKSSSEILPRLYENGKDPKKTDPGMGGGDFTNTFTIGGVVEDYRGNLPTLTSTKTRNDILLNELNIFPNPCDNYFEVEAEIDEVYIYDLKGKEMISGNRNKKIVVSNLSRGTYIVRALKDDNIFVQKLLKI